MSYIILFLLIVNTSIGFAVFFNKKFEETIFISIFSYILILFINGIIFNNLTIGFYLIIFLNILIFINNLRCIAKKKFSIKNQLLTLGFILFVLSYFLIIWICYGKLASEWDEFSHWAIIVKNMYNLNNLAIGLDSTALGKHYLSGPGIFQYFCIKLSGSFNESMMFIGMDLIILSTILPILKFFNTRKNFLLYILFGILFLLPISFYSNFYALLYVDGLLGLVAAYTLYSYFSCEEKDNKFKFINLACSFSMLIFIKDFGLIFALGIFLLILIDSLFLKNKFKFKNIWLNSKYILFSIMPIFFIKVFWNVFLQINHITSAPSTAGIFKTTINLFTWNLLDYQKTVIYSYFYGLFNTPLFNGSYSFILCIAISIAIGYLIISTCTNSKTKKQLTVLISFLILGAFAYAILLLIIPYLSIFSEYEAINLASFDRYMNSYLLFLFLSEIVFLIQNLYTNKKVLNNFIVVLFLLFIFTFPLNNIYHITFGARQEVQRTISNRIPFAKVNELVSKYIKNNEKLYFIATNTGGIEYHVARYSLTPIKINDIFTWSIGSPYYDGDIWTQSLSSESWMNILLKDYSYVYLFKVDSNFIESFGSLFDNSNNIHEGQLYKVNWNANHILELIAEQ